MPLAPITRIPLAVGDAVRYHGSITDLHGTGIFRGYYGDRPANMVVYLVDRDESIVCRAASITRTW